LEVLVSPRAKTKPNSRAERVVRFISVSPNFYCFLGWSQRLDYDLMNRKWQRGRGGDSQFREFFWGAEKAAKIGVNTEGAEDAGN
jgi:hypothetical protein